MNLNPCKHGHPTVAEAAGGRWFVWCMDCEEMFSSKTCDEAVAKWNAANPLTEPATFAPTDCNVGDPGAMWRKFELTGRDEDFAAYSKRQYEEFQRLDLAKHRRIAELERQLFEAHNSDLREYSGIVIRDTRIAELEAEVKRRDGVEFKAGYQQGFEEGVAEAVGPKQPRLKRKTKDVLRELREWVSLKYPTSAEVDQYQDDVLDKIDGMMKGGE